MTRRRIERSSATGHDPRLERALYRAVDNNVGEARAQAEKILEDYLLETGRKRKKLRLDAAEKFFYRHAGRGYIPGKETPEEGRRRNAIRLAAAEAEAKRRDWNCYWEHSNEPYEIGDAEDYVPDEVLNCYLRDQDNKVIASLHQIGDPSREYVRIIEAELADEQLPENLPRARDQRARKKRRH